MLNLKFKHHQSNEIKMLSLSRQQIIDEIGEYQLLDMLECNCEPVGETNVVDCNCGEYFEEFELIAEDDL